MAEFAWLAPVAHKNIGGSGHKLVPDKSLQFVCSRPGSATSLIETGDDNGFSYGQPSKTNLKEAGWKPQKPPKSAVRGAWQHQANLQPQKLGPGGRNSRPGSARSDMDMMSIQNSRPSSARSERDATVSVYKAIKKQRGNNEGSRLELDTTTLRTKSAHSRPNSAGYRLIPTYVDGADSVNKGLEDEIEYLQGSLLGDQRSRDNFILSDLSAEFVTLTQEKGLYERPRSGRSRGSSSDGNRHSRPDSQNSKQGSRLSSGHKSKHNFGSSGLKGKSDLNYVTEDLEKDRQARDKEMATGNNFKTAADANVQDLPTIVIDNHNNDTEEPESKKVKTREESIADARKRKLLMKLRHATAFKKLFDETRAESLRATMDMDQCYNVEDLNKAKAEQKEEEDRFKLVDNLKPTLPTGVPLKSSNAVKETKSKTKSFLNLADNGHHMMSPDSLAVMRSTINEKHRRNFGEQPWLLGRLALSKQTCRFELPMDMRILKTITPMEYLLKYCIIGRRRKTLYKNVFQRFDKDRDGWISNEELIKALKDIHVNYIDTKEIDVLLQMLYLDKSPKKKKYNVMMFSVISAFSERLVLFLRKLNRRKDQGLKERLEVADFSNLRWKIEGVDVNPPVKALLEVL